METTTDPAMKALYHKSLRLEGKSLDDLSDLIQIGLRSDESFGDRNHTLRRLFTAKRELAQRGQRRSRVSWQTP